MSKWYQRLDENGVRSEFAALESQVFPCSEKALYKKSIRKRWREFTKGIVKTPFNERTLDCVVQVSTA